MTMSCKKTLLLALAPILVRCSGAIDANGGLRASRQLQPSDCSFEALTSPNWMNNTEDLIPERHAWFYNRKLFAPIVNDTNIIAGVLYTYSQQVFKMSVIFPPLHPLESRKCDVTLKSQTSQDEYKTSCDIQENTWHCSVRIDALPTGNYDYLVEYQPMQGSSDLVYLYDGIVKAPHGYPRVAAMGCFGQDATSDKTKFVESVKEEKPDLVLLQGDQTYFSKSLSYGFIELVYTIQDITRSTPAIVQMDDHDYGEPNLWGAGNGDEESGSGFTKQVCLVNALQQQSMSHNPDPAKRSTLENGITVHYTSYQYGEVDFAVLEARKFKNYRTGKSLLGDEQEDWLQDWCSTSSDRVKVILSQTPVASLSTHSTRMGAPYGMGTATEGLIDTNGYPLEGRARLMDIVSGCSPLILSGDQHLGIAVAYDDYGVSECASPAVINDVFWRMNTYSLNETHVDGFGHRYRLLNAWNPHDDVLSLRSPWTSRWKSDEVKAKRADGFLMVELDGSTVTCSMRGYRNGSEPIWSVGIPATSPRRMRQR